MVTAPRYTGDTRPNPNPMLEMYLCKEVESATLGWPETRGVYSRLNSERNTADAVAIAPKAL
jgi:hypothetical protein